MDNFGNSFLGLVIGFLLVTLILEPERVAEWFETFQESRENFETGGTNE